MSYIIVTILVVLSGIFSGLTLGLFSLNLTALERKIKLGNQKAIKVYSIRKNGNLLLCTLLLGNVAVNSSMAIFLGTIATGVIAGVLSTALIVIFGEILPQAVFSRYALDVGAKSVWLVKIFIFLTYPISGPLAYLLNRFLGEELQTIWTKKEIEEIIRVHEDSPNSAIDQDEERILLGALSFSDKKSKDIMTPRTVVYSVEKDQIIDNKLIEEIKIKGFTRIPIYEEDQDNIIGFLLSKELLGIDYNKKEKVSQYSTLGKLIFIPEFMKLDILLDQFIKKRIHIAFVFDEFGVFTGIVTLEDVIEEILKMEIVDEADSIDDMQTFARKRFKNKISE